MDYKDLLARLVPSGSLTTPINNSNFGIIKDINKIIELRRWGKKFIPLYYQKELIDGIKKILGNDRLNCLLSLPTGTGKTITAATTVLESIVSVSELNKKNVLILWIAPQKELLYQASEAFQSAWWSGIGPSSFDIKIIESAKRIIHITRPTCLLLTPIVAKNIKNKLSKNIDVLIFDEAHHVAAEVFGQMWHEYVFSADDKPHLSLGLSATPFRNNIDEQRKLENAFDNKLLITRSLGENPIVKLIRDGILSVPKYKKIEGVPKVFIYKQRGDNRTIRNLILNDERWTAIIKCIRNNVDKQLIVFALDRLHGKFLTKHLKYLNESVEYVDGDTDIRIRYGVFERFRNRETRVIVNVSLMIEGVDCPAAEGVILTYPVSSNIRIQQIIGRVLRGPAIGGTKNSVIYGIDQSKLWLEQLLYKEKQVETGWEYKYCV